MIGGILLRAVAALVMAFLVLLLVGIVGTSLTAPKFLSFAPQGLTLAWYAKVLDDPSFVAAFTTSSLRAVRPIVKGTARILGTARWMIDRDDPVGAGFLMG